MAEIVSPRAFSVEEVNHYLRETLAEDDFLANILVYGQVTGCKLHSSGHFIFYATRRKCWIKSGSVSPLCFLVEEASCRGRGCIGPWRDFPL